VIQEAFASGSSLPKLDTSDTKAKQNDNSKQSTRNQQQNIPFEFLSHKICFA
jgi:hypothetical protein